MISIAFFVELAATGTTSIKKEKTTFACKTIIAVFLRSELRMSERHHLCKIHKISFIELFMGERHRDYHGCHHHVQCTHRNVNLPRSLYVVPYTFTHVHRPPPSTGTQTLTNSGRSSRFQGAQHQREVMLWFTKEANCHSRKEVRGCFGKCE